MMITISQPSTNQTFSIDDTITFAGTATDEIVRVELWADNQWNFRNSNVTDNNWSESYSFTQSGQREIEARGFDAQNHQIASDTISLTITASVKTCSPRTKLFKIGERDVWRISGETAFFFKSYMTIDADGAPNAYHPNNEGIDFLNNAGRPGNWWALVTDNGRSNGNPIIQKATDPFPGFYISTTALVDGNFAVQDPLRYVDATKIPYIVLPGNSLIRTTGVKKGDFAVVYYKQTNKLSFAIYADVGPKNKLGEGSVKLAQNLGHDPFVRGKVQKSITNDVFYLIFPSSGNGKPRNTAQIDTSTKLLFDSWGGKERLETCFKAI